jgi:hypothetical protein
MEAPATLHTVDGVEVTAAFWEQRLPAWSGACA